MSSRLLSNFISNLLVYVNLFWLYLHRKPMYGNYLTSTSFLKFFIIHEGRYKCWSLWEPGSFICVNISPRLCLWMLFSQSSVCLQLLVWFHMSNNSLIKTSYTLSPVMLSQALQKSSTALSLCAIVGPGLIWSSRTLYSRYFLDSGI